jgi:NADH-quinone oxidoreductase subunit H
MFFEVVNPCIINILAVLVSSLISTAFLTLLERKMIASIQRRTGPKVAGFYGLLQPFSDGLKLVLKDCIIPYRSNRFIFLVAPATIFFLSILNFTFLPIDIKSGPLVYTDYSLLYIILISSLQSFGFILSA